MGIVWDSDAGRTCPRCEQPIASCRCTDAATGTGDGIARLRIEKSGRQGKTVTVVDGLDGHENLKAIFKALKKRCGAGGAVKAGVIEIQGDHRDAIRTELQRRAIEVRG